MYRELNKKDKVILANRKVPLANRCNKNLSWNHTREPFLYATHKLQSLEGVCRM